MRANRVFLEFVRAERLFGEAPAAGFWFEEIFRLGVMGLNPSVGSAEEVKAKQAWLSSWGYGGTPFFAEVSGLLTWPVADGRFMDPPSAASQGCFCRLRQSMPAPLSA